MNADTIYTKTDAGLREMQHRSHGLDIRHRTLLIMLDGKRAVSDLETQLGRGDMLLPMLARLLELGLITGLSTTASAAVASPAAPVKAPPAAPAPAADTDWKQRRQRATHLLNEILGPMGDGLAVRMEALKSPEQLPELLQRGRELVRDLRGQSAAQRFEEAIGPLEP
ncbi:hypothetical protein [Pseudoxanthomonas wuyuanensis]|uniref:Uncharacterized protein n=1 Tax=Pseudoxanthomonas wuyuanensis TaxID=1073196 RepID=A0A286CY96_9GAMM|nr:hypothetical protein [Pseudoxanthomonas wuyuanensis]KAF1722696.1 hypothetical protein CSC75_02405 [Pseudoxanthomonas wuyuanensis]SOD51344.1 hypothetical protein SAMN06296416_101576 [Pseudoxanthomonas wuyuanensis]